MTDFISFPHDFHWGVASSAYQIEGGWNEDGKGPSVWDTFSHQPGKIYHGDNGDVAIDHYHRWKEDVQIMKSMGLKVYRFSIAWSRVLPDGQPSRINPAGLDFYDRLVDDLLANGIQPLPTLFHYDLPQALQDHGGFALRDTACFFGDYAGILARKLGDRVSTWLTINEPMVFALAGHLSGEHAPGLKDPQAAISAVHFQLLGHGLAVQAIRTAARQPVSVGIALNLSSIDPASSSSEDIDAAGRFDAILNRSMLDPLFRGEYSPDLLDLIGLLLPPMQSDDLQTIATPLDFLGVNYYSRAVIKHEPGVPIVEFAQVSPRGNPYSQMWEIYPQGMYELLTRIQREYHPAQIMVTENGIPVADALDFDGKVRDVRRIQYLQDHLIQVRKAMDAGVPINGYLVWSLMDNYEWAFGYRMRFGLVYVDFDNLQRTVKMSGEWYRQVIANHGFTPGTYYVEPDL
jgi:beta-glucosidase